jgi:hypothetical protein
VAIDVSSSFRRCGLRDDRRRRLLTDDLSDCGALPSRTWPSDAAPEQKSEYYGNAEFLDQQWRLLDLVPCRLVVLTLQLLAGAAIVAGLESAYASSLQRAAADGTVVAVLDVATKGSLACWFSSLMLLAASVAALLVYTVRRHRTDDYQGRYRVWLWAAGFWFLAATDQAASLREAFRAAMIDWTGTPLYRDGTLWWVVVYALVFGAIGSRLLLDMRPSRLSIAALSAAVVFYGLAMACHLGWTPIGTAVGEVIFRSSSEMAGHLMLLAAMAFHARYVILDAQGLVLHPEPREAKKTDAADDEVNEEVKVISAGGNRWRAIDPPHPAPQPVYQRPASSPAVAAKSVPATTSAQPELNRKLTKGERKALKERLLRERQERERKW